MMKNRMMPVRMSPKESFSWNLEEISLEPLPRNTSSRLVKIMPMGLNFAIQDTITAVKPLPPAVFTEMVWSEAPTSRKPARPQRAPDSSMVRIITQSTLMPT